MEAFDCIILGAGPAGLKATASLITCGHKVLMLEKEENPGGKLLRWDTLFPHGEKAGDILENLLAPVRDTIRTGVNIISINNSGNYFELIDDKSNIYRSLTLVVTTGFVPFDAGIKEEYGYGIYGNVITSIELEEMFANNDIHTSDGRIPGKVAFIHCVGSRDVKVSREHCSAVCCITGIKQAVELSKRIPGIRVSCLYMDLRLHGRFYEDRYKKAQMDYRIQFIRGRLSETNQNADGTIVLRYEDTLAGRPAKMTVDLVILLVGMDPAPLPPFTREPERAVDGFFGRGLTGDITGGTSPGLFFAGTCAGPKNLAETMNEATRMAVEASKYISAFKQTKQVTSGDGVRV